MVRRSTALTSSATERTCIFSITRRRCTFTVISLTPSSAAIYLFSMPLIASVSTSCSRGVRDMWRCFRA